MVCVPVITSSTSGTDEHVIGIITVDTNIDKYFGKKNDRRDEECAGNRIRPYSDYVAFVYSLVEFSSKIREIVMAKVDLLKN